MTNSRAIKILLVEDNAGDVFLTKKAFEKAKIENNIQVAVDGEEALKILKEARDSKYISSPDLVLLDINLPKKDGKQVLKEMKADNELRRIPVIILTSSESEEDILKTYDLHASSYIVKPDDLDGFQAVVTAIENFWFSAITLPNTP